MSKALLLEIGTEEIPAHAMPGLLRQLRENAEKKFQDLRLDYAELKTMGTPRRMALLVHGLADRQPDVSRETRGPSAQIAFDAYGHPTRAGEGFARGQKVEAKDLVQKNGYVYAIVHEEGKSAKELLQTALPELVCELSFPNSMRWGNLDFRFIRPLRWLVALYGSDIVPFSLAEVPTGRISQGHRFLGDGEFSIYTAENYEQDCETQFVIVDQERRRQMIRQQIEEVAAGHGGTAEITEDLLEEVLYLVEYPTALCGGFEDKYLKLPPEAVITPMRDHQRYFPVKDGDGKLLPLFITVRNGGRAYLETVQRGNERVLRARLADAQFFFDEDRKKTLEEHREKLKDVVFQEGLGSVYEKSGRLVKLVGQIADALGIAPEEKQKAQRAAELCKADLVTEMVTEFTELQGIMGREYARLDGEDEEVARAIAEHYQPRFSGDIQPQTTPGRIVSLADKLDNLVATFSRGLVPTGSQDPFALRRQALGMAKMLIEAKYHLSLAALGDTAMDLLGIHEAEARGNLQKEIANFLRLRLKNVLSDEKIRYDVVDAVLGNVDDVFAVFLRAKALSEALQGEITGTVQACVRVGNLAQKAGSADINESLLAIEEEKSLFLAYRLTEREVGRLADAGDYLGAIHALESLAAPIDAFFDKVMVMDKEETIRNNRLGLLKSIDQMVRKVADFSKIVLA